jgi:oligopeptidase A
MPALIKNADAKAKLLGYPSYAHQSLVRKLAASVGVLGVRKFNEDIAALARPKAQAEYEAMKAFAKEKLGIEELAPWDFMYVDEKMRQSLYTLDNEEVRKYFPFERVMKGLAFLIKSIYGVTMLENSHASVWHPSVKFYELYDEAGVLRGAFYADMYAREGKQPGAWMDVLLASRKLSDGVVIPVAYLVCNARKPGDGKEAYLTHDEVQTLFHEFGHTEHHVLGLSEYQDQSMNHVEWDTVELPSQLFECWTWEPELLRLMTAHEETMSPIPEDLVTRMLDAKFFNTGLFSLRQATYGFFDWELYSNYDAQNPVDPNALWKNVAATMDVRPLDEVNCFPNSFKHIFSGGYSAGYFSYMWALGLSADTFLSFKEEGDIFSRKVGQRLLDEIIAPGSERPMAESFEIFRGRKLDPKALAVHLGLLEK